MKGKQLAENALYELWEFRTAVRMTEMIWLKSYLRKRNALEKTLEGLC